MHIHCAVFFFNYPIDNRKLVFLDLMMTNLVELHTVPNNLNLRLKTKPVTVGKDATVYVWFLYQMFANKAGH